MLKNVNTTDLYSAIELGCRTMSNVFNADDNDIPFFRSIAWPKAFLSFSAWNNESHVPGRHLNALLAAEAVAGVRVEDEVIRKHAAAAYYSFSGLIPLPLNRDEDAQRNPIGELKQFSGHNIREGMHAMYALSRFRKDKKADQVMHRAIAYIQENFIPNLAWDSEKLKTMGVEHGFYAFLHDAPRSIGPLVKYYRSSGYEPALQLAVQLAEAALKYFPESGAFDPDQLKCPHVHSITSVLSSLAQLGETLNDHALLDRVRGFYDNGLQAMCNELGWFEEMTNGGTRGEVNCSGDMVETALILAKFYGPKYYDDAERILRGHILPSQIRDTDFIVEQENPEGKDGLRDVANRHLGAFGFPAPYGHHPREMSSISFNMDIVGGTVGSLCEAYAACTSYENGIHRVNLLFDRETEYLQVQSPYTHDGLIVTVKQAGPLFIRIPTWLEPAEIQVTGADWLLFREWIYVPQPEVGVPVHVTFPMVVRDVTLHHTKYTLKARLRGDIVEAMENEGMGMTFFPDYPDTEE